MCRIWDESFKQKPEQGELPPILPVVFHQDERTWRHSTEFADLFSEGERDHNFLPRFGGLKAKVAQLLVMAAHRTHRRQANFLQTHQLDGFANYRT